MTRTTLIALACLALALGGCATWPAANGASAGDGLASPASRAPGAPPSNVYFPEPAHDFGTGGP